MEDTGEPFQIFIKWVTIHDILALTVYDILAY